MGHQDAPGSCKNPVLTAPTYDKGFGVGAYLVRCSQFFSCHVQLPKPVLHICSTGTECSGSSWDRTQNSGFTKGFGWVSLSASLYRSRLKKKASVPQAVILCFAEPNALSFAGRKATFKAIDEGGPKPILLGHIPVRSNRLLRFMRAKHIGCMAVWRNNRHSETSLMRSVPVQIQGFRKAICVLVFFCGVALHEHVT